MEGKDQIRWRDPTGSTESIQLIHRIDIEDLFQIESPSEWEINLHLGDEGIYRRKFTEQDLHLMTRQERRALLGERQGLLLKLPCSRAELADFIRREGLRHRIDRHYLRELNAKRCLDQRRTPESSVGLGAVEQSAPTLDRGSRVKRRALIQNNLLRWPTVKRDLRDGAENGLSKAARDYPGHGWWWEGSALEWARAAGKLTDAGAGLSGMTGAIHRLWA